jgi:hypothetical protein
MDSSIIAWPVGPEACFIQQRSTNRTVQANLFMPEVASIALAQEFYDETLDRFIATDLPELGNRPNAPWWKFPDQKSNRQADGGDVLLDPAVTGKWACCTDCRLGREVAKESRMTTCLYSAHEFVESSSYADMPVVFITATIRPKLLSHLLAMGATAILPVFEIRSQLIIGPVLTGQHCPCPICLYARLAANDISLEAFRSRCRAAESHPSFFAARDIITGLPKGMELPAIEATADAIRRIAGSWRLNGGSSMIRFDLASGQQHVVKFQPLPGQHQQHWLRQRLQQDL